VLSVAFSPGGRSLVTGGEDVTARLWELPSGRQLGVLRGHSGRVLDASFTPDGKGVVTASADATARVFPCDACGSFDTLVRRARERATRSLSPEERRRFLTFAE
jgi:WD40 repeat protein